MNYIGVDGCKNGWFYVSFDDDDNWESGVTPCIQSLGEKFPEVYLILVDIPIGLRHEGNLERRCDKEARKVLGTRRSSVFPVPCRKAVYESNYKEASHINHELTGRYLSKQSWAISNKIRQVDQLLTSSMTQKLIREVHPEICFWSLNERNSMKYSKKTLKGFDERLEVIKKFYGKCDAVAKDALLKYKRYEVTMDDILDALVAAVTAKFGFKALKTIPDAPEYDEMGLSMEIVYYTKSAC